MVDTIRRRVGTFNAPLAPVAILGAEIDAVEAMGENANYWRAFDGAFVGAGTEEFQWLPRVGDVPLNRGGSSWPTFTDGAIPYLASTDETKSLVTPPGVAILPQTSHAVVTLAYQPGTATGVIWGNRADYLMTSTTEASFEGLATGHNLLEDDLIYMTRGYNQRVTVPDANTYRDNQWHVLTVLFTTGAQNVARLRVDGAQIATNTDIQAPMAALNLREMRLFASGQNAPMAGFLGRVAAHAVVRRDLNAEAAALHEIEAYFGSLAGITIPAP
ncbi:hypothetical protein [Kumtagia ephedrae]|uniref:Uncharacterized protein n=1 Tax=Kumtagia ephedrae TaxID=2116701 RepID=A0A2P7SPW7_9HYPH|nr:hypothetical protein [Mesorhizobium ephedrae]PSJ64513.1 hypothetical protein C7I84_06105 [Mesorhizobium ephedrae]